jgi:hypothetical protein
MFSFAYATKFWIVQFADQSAKFYKSTRPNHYECITWNGASNNPDKPLISWHEGPDGRAMHNEAKGAKEYFREDDNGVEFKRYYDKWKRYTDKLKAFQSYIKAVA